MAWNAVLDEDEVARSMRFRRDADRDRFVVGRGLLRTMLGSAVNRSPRALRFDANPYGKPLLRSAEPMAFNVAHSGDYVMVAVGPVKSIGVDIEEHRGDMDLPALSLKIFTRTERRALLLAQERDRTAVFFRHWVLKEALLKGLGTGFSFDPLLVDIVLADGRLAARTQTGVQDVPVAREWVLHDVPVAAGYSAALAILP